LVPTPIFALIRCFPPAFSLKSLNPCFLEVESPKSAEIIPARSGEEFKLIHRDALNPSAAVKAVAGTDK